MYPGLQAQTDMGTCEPLRDPEDSHLVTSRSNTGSSINSNSSANTRSSSTTESLIRHLTDCPASNDFEAEEEGGEEDIDEEGEEGLYEAEGGDAEEPEVLGNMDSLPLQQSSTCIDTVDQDYETFGGGLPTPESTAFPTEQPVHPLPNERKLYRVEETNDGRRWFCLVPGCNKNASFTRPSDLDRHQKTHSGAIPPFQCCCCQELLERKPYMAHRKDHLAQHMRKKHMSVEYWICESPECANGIELVCSSRECFLAHKRVRHGLTTSEATELRGTIPMHQCLRSLAPKKQSKRTKYLSASSTNNDFDNPHSSQEHLNQDSYNLMHSQQVPEPSTQSLAGIGHWSEAQEFASRPSFDFNAPQMSVLPALGSLDEPIDPCPDDREEVSLYVDNVPPVDFLTRFKALLSIESTLSAFASSSIFGISVKQAYISYNWVKNKLSVHGPKFWAWEAKKEVQTALKKPCGPPWRGSHQSGSDTQEFSLRQKEDSDLISTWEQEILPRLSSILRPRIGKDYSACFVREGSTFRTSRPCIQVECPKVLTSSNKKGIRKALKSLLQYKSWFSMIKVQFYKGRVAYLAGEDSSDEGDEDEDEGNHEDAFDPLKRYWQKIGMSASVGLSTSPGVSATSGGYILVDDHPYLLLVDHFIEESIDPEKLGEKAPLLVTSPSLNDVEETRTKLKKNLDKYEPFTRNLENDDQDRSLQDFKELFAEVYTRDEFEEFIRSKFLFNEVNKRDEDFVLGRVVRRCAKDYAGLRSSVTPQPGKDGNNALKMDWALVEVTAKERRGVNQHRWRRSDDTSELDYNDEEHGGDLCQHVIPLKPNAKVYYVGRKSGLREGEISSTRILASKDGIHSYEWHMVPRTRVAEEDCTGDSGAWVIMNANNHLMAQLWGYAGGKLLVSPITEIFEDIREAFDAETVDLPRNPPDELLSYTNICEVNKKKKTRKAKGFKASTLPPLTSVLGAMGISDPVLPPARAPPPLSPVPSLVSSRSSSSPERKTPPPGPLSAGRHSPSTPIQLDPPALGPSVPAVEPTILNADDPAGGPSPISHEPEALEEAFAVATAENVKRGKQSLHYILRHAATERPIAMPKPIPPRKAGTFPFLDNSAAAAEALRRARNGRPAFAQHARRAAAV